MFFSSTVPSAAALRASFWCAGLLMTDASIEPYLPPPGSNSPSRTRTERMSDTALSMSGTFNRPCWRAELTAAVVGPGSALLSVKLSTPALRAAASPSAIVG